LKIQYRSCIKSFDNKLHETQSNLDESNGKINDITSQIKKLQDQHTQLNNKQSQMKDEIENLKKENSSLKKELFIAQELVQKHENFIESISADSSPVTSSTHRDQISNHNQAPSQSPNDNPVQTTTSLLAAKQSTTISQELSQHQRSHNHDEKVKTNSVTLLIDSNGKQLQPNLLYPDSKPLICPTYTLQQLKDNINTLQSKPDILLIHCGTNDLEQTTPAIVIQETKNILTHAKSSFPAAKIIYSSILPRQDNLQQQVHTVNTDLFYFCKSNDIKFISHQHINKPFQFNDFKHLNYHGVKFFAKNLKSALFNTPTKQSKGRHSSNPRHL